MRPTAAYRIAYTAHMLQSHNLPYLIHVCFNQWPSYFKYGQHHHPELPCLPHYASFFYHAAITEYVFYLIREDQRHILYDQACVLDYNTHLVFHVTYLCKKSEKQPNALFIENTGVYCSTNVDMTWQCLSTVCNFTLIVLNVYLMWIILILVETYIFDNLIKVH